MKKLDSAVENKVAGFPRGFGIEWSTRRSFNCAGHAFEIPGSFEDFLIRGDQEPSSDKFFLVKTPDIIQRYLALFSEKKSYRNIVELGVFRGGSAAFVQSIAKPEKLLALELAPERLEILDEFIQSEGLEGSLRAEYGIDQGDSRLVSQLKNEHIGEGRCVDLVIDDASHLLGPTRASFETLFPLVRPGGSYVIEDYASTHILNVEWLDRAEEDFKPAQTLITDGMASGLEEDQKPLHLLAVEAMLASIAAPGLIRKVVVDRHWVRMIRGKEDVDPNVEFDLRALAADEFGLLESQPSERLGQFLA